MENQEIENQKMENKKTEVSKKRKKIFFIFLVVYFLGFILLMTIGEKMNQNQFLLRSFIAPLLTLTGIVAIAYNFYRK